MSSGDLDLQRSFWDGWNLNLRAGQIDSFMGRQISEALATAETLRCQTSDLRILDVGCGTGWLAAALTDFGQVTATDISDAAIEFGRVQAPDVHFVAGDFASLQLDGPFDLVVSADVISHVADQQVFIDRIRDLLRPGGLLLLMTQNGFVWRRSSCLAPPQPGQLRNWPSLARLRVLLSPSFDVVRVGSIVPGGDAGVLRVVNSRWISGPLRRVGLGGAWTSVRERARLGRELVVVARRR